MNSPKGLAHVALKTSATVASALAPRVNWHDMGKSEHFVQFYEDDTFLVRAVADFVGAGIEAGDVGIVIATPAHRVEIAEYLRNQGLDVAALENNKIYFPLDAADTLATFMIGDAPDAALFQEHVGGLFAQLGGRGIRAFGEMVALLWLQGNAEAAIRLEQLWNNLSHTYVFSLFCAYPMRNFQGAAHGAPFMHICQEHSRVIPAESYATESDADERLRMISRLQQKAVSLEQEIADRQSAEARTREQQTRLEMAVALAGQGIWELDLANEKLSCSAQCKSHFGLNPNDVLGYEEFFALVHPEDRERVREIVHGSIAAHEGCNIEYRVLGGDGRVRWLAVQGRCVRHDGYHMLGVTLDISERKRAAAILEQTVVERTAQLQEIIGELEAFSYSISHDMRAPLRAMQGYAGILLEECQTLDAQHRDYLERISASAERMDLLIQDVLALSRVVRSEFPLSPINLTALVSGILVSYPNLQPPQAHITLSGELSVVMGNEAALTQCLSNLLANAVKFVAPGTVPHVRIWVEAAQDAQGTWTRLCIADNGIGISKEMHEKIFGMFHRLSKDYEGTGIGLAIVKKAVERMGGYVDLQSAPGQGSIFRLHLRPVL